MATSTRVARVTEAPPEPRNARTSITGSSWPRTFERPRIQLFAPGTRVTDGGIAHHLAGFLAGEQERLAAEPEGDAHPLGAGRRRLGLALGRRARTTIELAGATRRAGRGAT